MTEIILAGIYIALALLGWRLLTVLNSKENSWHLVDLLSNESGRASLAHVLQAIGSVTMTWAFLYFTFQRSLTDAYVGIYAAYHAALYGVNKFSGGPNVADPARK